MLSFLLLIFTSIPHLTFKFKWITNNFDLDWESEYAQSLVIIAGVCGFFALLLLLTIAVTWVCKCCSKDVITAKSKRKVQRLSTALFILSVFCFFCLGFCLVGNDQINKGVGSSVIALKDLNRAFKLAEAQTQNLNTTCQNATLHLRKLEDVVHRESKKPGINQTLVSQIDTQLTSLSDNLDLVTDKLNRIHTILTGVKYLEDANDWAEKIEFERWLGMVFVFSIMLCILFLGVISFCRKSKKGTNVFSGTGFVILFFVWVTLCIVLPISVALSDFCSSGGNFIQTKLTPSMISTLEFYRTCDERPTHDNVPPVMGATNVSDALTQIQATKIKLDSLLDTTFNQSQLVANTSAFISVDSTMSLKQIGALESGLACYTYKTDIAALHSGICDQAIVGAAILVFCLFLLAMFLFVLLMIVCKAWNLFSRLPSDYVEVDEDDPFFPRTNDSNIPVDIYGTHVFNPRTRERVEASSTNTTTATAPGADENAPLWNRSSVNTSSNRPSMFPEFAYGNYEDQNNI